MLDLASVVSQVRRGMIPAHVYADPEIFAAERDRLFARSWTFLAHESEIPDPGDYVVRRVLADSFIVARDEAGVVRVMFNMCLHRGMQVCRAELGNASHFRCPYHAWTYRNDGRLAGLPFHEEAYGGEDGFARAGQSLLPAPSMGIAQRADLHQPGPGRAGASRTTSATSRSTSTSIPARARPAWSCAAPSGGGSRPTGRSARRTSPATATTPRIPTPAWWTSACSASRRPASARRAPSTRPAPARAPPTSCRLAEGFADQLRYVGYPDAMIPAMAAAWSDRQRALVADSGFMPSAATLFPNLSFVHNWPQIDADGTVAPFISLRQWQPVSERETEVLSWFAVDAAAPEDFKRRSYTAYLMCFGSSGMFEQDDVENWVSITDMAAGSMARRLTLNSRMGLTSEGKPVKPPLATFAGPGVAYQGFGEYGQRHWLGLWADCLSREAR